MNSKAIAKYSVMELIQVVSLLSAQGSSLYLPVITPKKDGQNDIAEVGGTAVFKKDKLIGFLDAEESKYFYFAINEVTGGVIPIKYIGENKANLTLEILSNRTSITPQMQDGKPKIKLFIPTEVTLGENGSMVNYAEQFNLGIVKVATEKKYARKRKKSNLKSPKGI